MKMLAESVSSGDGEDPQGRNPWKDVGYRFFESATHRFVAVVLAARRFLQA
jgi:hypothetical protein